MHQLAASQYAIQPNLARLIHQIDNHCGSFQGAGAVSAMRFTRHRRMPLASNTAQGITMSGSTSLRSARAERSRHAAILLAAVASMTFMHATASSASGDQVDGLVATADELRRATLPVASALKDQPDLPEALATIQKSQTSLRWSSAQGNKRLLASVNIRYNGFTNSYCRLLTLPADLRSAQLVPVPPDVNTEDCIGITTVLYVDLNGDGATDVVQGLRMKSNRYTASATVAAIYLSSAGAKSGYCYSAQASRQISAADLRSSGDALRAFEKERKRLNPAQFQCSQ